jgi:hypothetical protein
MTLVLYVWLNCPGSSLNDGHILCSRSLLQYEVIIFQQEQLHCDNAPSSFHRHVLCIYINLCIEKVPSAADYYFHYAIWGCHSSELLTINTLYEPKLRRSSTTGEQYFIAVSHVYYISIDNIQCVYMKFHIPYKWESLQLTICVNY